MPVGQAPDGNRGRHGQAVERPGAIASLFRTVLYKVLRTSDRFVHTRARRQASLRTGRRDVPQRVTFVCFGNICRSPYAAAYLARRLLGKGPGPIVESAGLFGPGRPANDLGSVVAQSRGLDLSGHRSRLFEVSEAFEVDLVLVMTRSQRDQLVLQFGVPQNRIELLGDFDLADPPGREIDDPYGRSDDEFRRVFSQIERSVDGLCQVWATGKPLER